MHTTKNVRNSHRSMVWAGSMVSAILSMLHFLRFSSTFVRRAGSMRCRQKQSCLSFSGKAIACFECNASYLIDPFQELLSQVDQRHEQPLSSIRNFARISSMRKVELEVLLEVFYLHAFRALGLLYAEITVLRLLVAFVLFLVGLDTKKSDNHHS